VVRWALKNILEAKKTAGFASVCRYAGYFRFGISREPNLRLVKANLFPTPLLQGEQLLVQLDRPPLPTSDP